MTPDELIARAAAGTLTPEEAARLAAACREDAEVLRALAEHIATERLLHTVASDPHGTATAQEIALRLEHERLAVATGPGFVPRVVESARRRVWLPRLALAAAVLLFAGLGALFLKRSSREQPEFAADGPTSVRAESPAAVAVLKRAAGVEWISAANSPAVGGMLGAGWLKLRAGTLQIEFLGGARVLVAGPAELRLDSDNAAFLETGKASAYVPESARGFKMRAPGVDIVDLGTAFGLEVGARHPAEVHVFNGAVTVSHDTSAPHRLDAGKAARLDGGSFREIPVRPADFPNGEELARHADAEGRARAKEWQAATTRLAADPATLLSYTFDNETQWSRTVKNRASRATEESHGALVGAGWTGGRWPTKRALEFRSLADRLRFTIPERRDKLTLMAWVRVDSLPNDYNSLLLPSRYVPGSLHWMLERGGELRLTMVNNPARTLSQDGWDGPVSGPAVSNMDFGRWLFLATTYDAVTGTVTHYRDGQRIGQGKFTHRLGAVLGPVEFGNWGADGTSPDTAWTRSQESYQRTRNFVGRLDELSILARVLPAEEIARLYEVGRP
jgi:hypothetical protein